MLAGLLGKDGGMPHEQGPAATRPLGDVLAFMRSIVVIFGSLTTPFSHRRISAKFCGECRPTVFGALGLTFVIITRQYDMAFPWVASLGAMTMGWFVAAGFDVPTAILAGLAAGLGLRRHQWNRHRPFRSAGYDHDDRHRLDRFRPLLPLQQWRLDLRKFHDLGHPLAQRRPPVRGAAADPAARRLLVGLVAFLNHTRFGNAFYATGENRRSAWFSGIPVSAAMWWPAFACPACSQVSAPWSRALRWAWPTSAPA